MLLTNVELYVILYIPNEREENKMKIFMLGKRTIINVNEIAGAKVSNNLLVVYLKNGTQFSEAFKDSNESVEEMLLLMDMMKETN